MPVSNRPFLVDNIVGGVDTTSPTHTVLPPRWLSAHNMRFDPRCRQVEKKKVYATISGENDVIALPVVPGSTQGYGRVLVFTKNKLMRLNGSPINSAFVYDNEYRRWSYCFYNGFVYYTNELNPIRRTDGIRDLAISTAPASRYVLTWYDHLVGTVGSRLVWSHLYNFSKWEPDATNEADFYDLVEWQDPDYPFTGITGIGKIGGTLWVYTPTAIVPFRYAGIQQGVAQLIDDQVLTRIGNTFPWTLAALDRTHFFYDGIEQNFFAFDGQNPVPVGEPIRGYIEDNLNLTPKLAAKMWATVDVQNREIWWRFVSKDSEGAFDKAVVFNYRLKLWFTASTENVQAFCGAVFVNKTIAELEGTMGNVLRSVDGIALFITLTGHTPTEFVYTTDGFAAGEDAWVASTEFLGELVQIWKGNYPGFPYDQKLIIAITTETLSFSYFRGDDEPFDLTDPGDLEGEYVKVGGDYPDGAPETLHVTYYGLTGTIGELGISGNRVPHLYGAEDGKVYRDEIPSDPDSELVPVDDPVLETGDFLYGSLHAVKEARSVAVNAAMVSGQLDVGVNARDYLDDSVDWTDRENKAGTWSRTLPEGRLTHQAKSGKVLRYRFVGNKTRGLKFTAFEPTVYSMGAEK